ncbi:M20/M25/M40 family metallo-hydrolase [Embleya sp. NPDC050154]|uniref:M20/M25/M40 family metallo-hydrolase n=1 Tax=Embleya sp. NPDC050154 TaxID=3363988 RepID=UPI0037B91E8E
MDPHHPATGRPPAEGRSNPRVLPGGCAGVGCDVFPNDGAADRAFIALRGDMDALPVTDPGDVPWRSTVDGACHACGHDVHTSAIPGVGLDLVGLRGPGLLFGPARPVFRPVEAIRPGGALRVVVAGGLDGVESSRTVRGDSTVEVGRVAVLGGPIMSGMGMLRLRVEGAGGRGARPHVAVNVVVGLWRMVFALRGLGRSSSPATAWCSPGPWCTPGEPRST